ncbi:sigma 54-interacting transcriptional regulator [Irregularibacter muris]|uniref:Sigma 54-interacting transcriptional regulator n=1 Tax=Irregularibacter muris TaxID=1796619 RepID=A0AAE3HIB4_9FIRM|nr:sigma-54-dependent transcriptional regulator [Irregularibacter muris]MCR1899108.1 sigma 54-interacting transcriptional regulator [Irregularibacter muris]
MSRKQIIYDCLINLCNSTTLEEIEEGFLGFETRIISKKTGFIRNNVSKELNQLTREGKVIKVVGRPTYYFVYQKMNELLGKILDAENLEVESLRSIIATTNEEKGIDFINEDTDTDIFHSIIGFESSLKVPILQAKAAISYPPNGLNMLLIGPTGSGKSMFAEIIYKYALDNNLVEPEANFVIFNCAEYANNPQLLLSQLFGHKKGAYTGATSDSMGLVEKANGGIFFLDEVHRLPPQAQEMLFLLIDKNIYRRLGETDIDRTAKVLLIAATTEDINSVLLTTFLRRFPMVITMPSLEERLLNERYELIYEFFLNQSKIINANIRVNKSVMKALLLYDCKGNVGQLKNDIQIICARGFLDYKTKSKNQIELDASTLPNHVYNGLLKMQEKRKEILNFFNINNRDYYDFSSENKKQRFYNDKDDFSEELYKKIGEVFEIYTKRGYSNNKIKKLLQISIDKYLQQLLSKMDINNYEISPEKEKLFKIVDPKIYNTVGKTILEFGSEISNKNEIEKLTIALSLHINEIIENKDEKNHIFPMRLQEISVSYPKEYFIARKIRMNIDQELNIYISEYEVGIITMLISSVTSIQKSKKIGVMIIGHGSKTASSMASVCNEMLMTTHCKAIDMSLDMKIDDTLEKASILAKNINEGKGILLLVDMGSLVSFGELVEKKTGIKTLTIDKVSTPLVLKAVSKALLPGMTLEQLALEWNDEETKSKIMDNKKDNFNQKTIEGKYCIITFCLTQDGTSQKLAQLLRENIPSIAYNNIEIITMSLEKVKKISQEEYGNIIALIGSVNLKIESIPYISTDEILVKDGLDKINNMIAELGFDVPNNYHFANLSMRLIEESLSFLNPEKTYEILEITLQEILNKLKIDNTDGLYIRFLLHGSYMLERVIKKEPLPYKDIATYIQQHSDLYNVIRQSFKKVEEIFSIKIPNTEIGYLVEMIDTL